MGSEMCIRDSLDKRAYFMSEKELGYLAVVGLLDEKIDLKITQSCEY